MDVLVSWYDIYASVMDSNSFLTLGTCMRIVVVCVSVTMLAATYIVYTSKVRCHIGFFITLSRFLLCGFC